MRIRTFYRGWIEWRNIFGRSLVSIPHGAYTKSRNSSSEFLLSLLCLVSLLYSTRELENGNKSASLPSSLIFLIAVTRELWIIRLHFRCLFPILHIGGLWPSQAKMPNAGRACLCFNVPNRNGIGFSIEHRRVICSSLIKFYNESMP